MFACWFMQMVIRNNTFLLDLLFFSQVFFTPVLVWNVGGEVNAVVLI